MVDPNSVLRHVRGEQAQEAERRNEQHVMPLVAAGDYGGLLFALDESDPIFQCGKQDQPTSNELKNPETRNNADDSTALGDSTTLEENAQTSNSIVEQQDPATHQVNMSNSNDDMDISDSGDNGDDNDYPLSDLIEAKKEASTALDIDSIHDDDDDNDDCLLSTLKRTKKQPTTADKDGCLLSTLKKTKKTQTNAFHRDRSDDKNEGGGGSDRGDDGRNSMEVEPEIPSEDDDKNHDPEEIIMLKHLERSITDAEENLYLGRLSHNITKAEEVIMMSLLGENISKALDREKQVGGKILYAVLVNPEEEIPVDIVKKIREFDLFEQMEVLQEKIVAHKKKYYDGAAIDSFEYVGQGEITVTKEFPKFIGSGMPWTETELREKFLDIIQHQGAEFDSFHVVVRVKENEPDTVVVELSGKPSFIEKAKDYLAIFIKVKQMQFRSLLPLRKSGASSKEKRAKGAAKRSAEFYNNFSNKYADLREIEFSGMGNMSVRSSMWQMHKKHFGNVCHPSCACAIYLHVLTSTVVDNYVRKHQEQNKINAISVAGFADNFAKKFTQLLRDEYPSDTNENIYRRLISMWAQHSQQRRFGLKCKPDCPCAEGWVDVFHKGRSKDERRVMFKKKSKDKESFQVSPQEKEATTLKIPRNKSSGASSLIPKQKEYMITFNPRQQLGFYVTTKKSVCKILSVNSIGSKIDPRLCMDTIILSCATGEKNSFWHQIDNHDRLKQLFDEAKNEGKEIHIRFINSDVKGSLTGRDGRGWTSNNSWKGNFNSQGWAGGAIDLSKSPKVSNNTEKQNTRKSWQVENIKFPEATLTVEPKPIVEQDLSSYRNANNASFRNSNPGLNEVALVQEVDLTEPSHRQKSQQNIRPILKVPRFSGKTHEQATKPQDSLFRRFAHVSKRSVPVRLKWADAFDTRLYYPKDMTFKAPQRSTQTLSYASLDKEVTPTPSTRVPSGNDLLLAIKNVNSTQLFGLLESGAACRLIDNEEKMQPESIARRIEGSLERKLQQNPSPEVHRQVDAANMNVKLIKVFDYATLCLDKCRWVRKWRGYQLCMESVNGLVLPEQHRKPGLKVTCSVEIQGENLGKLPLMEFSDCIRWDSRNKRSYRFNHNAAMPEHLKSSRVSRNSFTLQTIYPDETKLDLGSYAFTQDEFVEKVVGNNAATFEVTFTPKIEYMKPARAMISIKQDREKTQRRIQEQKDKVLKDVRNVLDSIRQFNEDKLRKSLGLPPLSVNTRFGDSTLLHAAVHLNDENLVDKLIAEGADPNATFAGQLSPRKLVLDLSEKLAFTQTEEQKERFNKILRLLGLEGNAPEVSGLKLYENDETSYGNSNGGGDYVESSESQRSRKRELINDKQMHSNKIPRLEPRTRDVPGLHLDKLLGGRPVCRFYGNLKIGGCKRGNSCRYAHVSKIEPRDSIDITAYRCSYNESDVMVTKDVNSTGATCFTAMFWDRVTNVFLPAAGGSTIGVNGSGVFWYLSERDAREAMSRTIAALQHGNTQNLSIPMPRRGSSVVTPICQKERIHAINQAGQFHHDENERTCFRRLLHANLNNNFGHIVRQQNLKSDDWKIHETPAGRLNASFTKSISPNIQHKTFTSSDHGGAKFENGVWYHADIKGAKASAFLEFIKFCISSRLAESFEKRIDGKTFPYMNMQRKHH
eukprot:CAMPEP_0194222424 /NCGR_PEP_ID=MMETSP0156-20130528/32901_1 /TAXON_ID=33649 /ORGANISM="Thalassionema nitzschioides, Strain L26-B" /LENGTH=1654 /DNA_ID=CAMNT_0038953203 /DNA_START=88 /DNA_END=5052 /DNA_ORIENTATION=+